MEVLQLTADAVAVDLGVERPPLDGPEVEHAGGPESAHLGGRLVGRIADQLEELPLLVEVYGGDGRDHGRGEAGRRRVGLRPHLAQVVQEAAVVVVHRSPPVVSAMRTLARQRARVGPMLPTGMSRSWLRDW